MQKCYWVVMAVAGIVLGVVLFLLRRTVSPASCRNCCALKREILLNAVIVSGMLSYLCFCGSTALGKDAQDASGKLAAAGITDIQAFEQTKEWQELKVLWNLITGNLDFLQNDSGDRMMGHPGAIPAWKLSLLKTTIDYRMTQLDRLVQQGLLSATTRRAIATLFTDMVGHVGSSNSGATCYMMTEEGGRWASAMSGVETQAKELRKHYRGGSLKDDVLKDIEAQLREKLLVLEILGDTPVDEITDDDINARIKLWRQQGRIHTRWIGNAIRREVREEITKEKEATLPKDELAKRKEAWDRDQSMILALAVDLGRYTPDRAAEKEIKKELTGKTACDKILARLKTADSYEKKSLVQGLTVVGGKDAIPVLMELLHDKTLSSYSSTTSSYDSSDPQAMEKFERSMTRYVEFTIRDAASAALRELGAEAPPESKKQAESPEGRAMVKDALGSADPEVKRSAIHAAGMTRDKTLIPVIEKMAMDDRSLVDDVLYALGEMKDPSVLQFVITVAGDADTDPVAVASALHKIGTKEALGYLQEQASSSKDPSMRECAINLLAEKKDKAFLPVFKEALEDKEIAVKLSAAIAMQAMGCEDGVPVLAEAAKFPDRDISSKAMHALKQSQDPRASEFLKAYAQTPDGEGQKEAILTIIGKGGEDACRALETILNGTDAKQKQRALNRVGQSKTDIPEMHALLIKSLTNDNERVREAAVTAISRKGTTNDIPVLLAYYRSRQDDIGASLFLVADAIKTIKKQTSSDQLGSFLTDITGEDSAKLAQAEKRKASLTNADIQALIVVLEDYGRPETERKAAEKILRDLGSRSVGPIIHHFSEQPSDMTGSQWTLMEMLDQHMDVTIPAVMTFIGDTTKCGREVGIEVLQGQGPRRKKYPLDKIVGMKDLLVTCSADKDAKVRAASMSLLLKMESSGDSALDTVLSGLNDASWDVRFQTILSIKYDRKGRQWNPEQKSRIAKALVSILAESKGTHNTRYVLDALEQFRDISAIPVLMTMIKAGETDEESAPRMISRIDPYTPVQQAAKLLFMMSDEATLSFWKEATGNRDDIVTLWAYAALFKLNQSPEESIKRISVILHDTDSRPLRMAGLDVMKTLNDKQCIPILRHYLQGDSPAKGNAIEPLPRVGSSSDHDEDRQEAFNLFADLGGSALLEDFKRIFKEDPDGYVRRDAADRLVSYAGDEAPSLLVAGLQDRSPGVRYHICELLGIAGRKDIASTLKKVAESDPYREEKKEEYPVRDEANRALKKIAVLEDADIGDRLIREATNKDSDLRFWAIERLGELPDKPAAAETLTTLLKDPTPACTCGKYHVREAAAESLRKLGKRVTEKENGVFEVGN